MDANFDKGFFDEPEVHNAVEQSKHLFSENTPAWKKLWYAPELQDDEISKLLIQVDAEFKNRQHTEVEVVLHIFGILLYLSDVGIHTDTKVQILIEGKAYIDYLRLNKYLVNQADVINGEFFHDAAYGLCYSEKESTEFKQINDYLIEKSKQAAIENYPTIATTLLELMKNDVLSFSNQLCLCNHQDNRYYEIPILASINVCTFVSNFIGLSQRARWNICSMLKRRYEFATFNKKLFDESIWLENVSIKLTAQAAKIPKTMKSHNLLKAAADFTKASNELVEKN